MKPIQWPQGTMILMSWSLALGLTACSQAEFSHIQETQRQQEEGQALQPEPDEGSESPVLVPSPEPRPVGPIGPGAPPTGPRPTPPPVEIIEVTPPQPTTPARPPVVVTPPTAVPSGPTLPPRVVTWFDTDIRSPDILSVCHGERQVRPTTPAPRPVQPEPCVEVPAPPPVELEPIIVTPPPVVEAPPVRPTPKPQPTPAPPPVVTARPPQVVESPLDRELRTQQLDILFVVNSSSSMDSQRQAILSQMNSFVRQLPRVLRSGREEYLDYNVGVLLANGPDARNDRPTHAQLFKYTGQNSQGLRDDFVLRSADLKRQGMNDEQVLTEIQRRLNAKINMIPSQGRDQSLGHGDMGLFSLYQALTNPHRFKKNHDDYGFFRANAALAVIFVADSQDACYAEEIDSLPKVFYAPNVLPAPQVNHKSQYCVVGTYSGFDAYGRRQPVMNERAETLHQHLSPQMVYDVLKGRVGERPLIVSGILHTPGNSQVDSSKVGRGYLEVISLAQGQAIELGDGQYNQSLAILGQVADLRLRLNNRFQIFDDHLGLVDESSFQVEILENGVHTGNLNAKDLVFQTQQGHIKYILVSDRAMNELAQIPGASLRLRYSLATTAP